MLGLIRLLVLCGFFGNSLGDISVVVGNVGNYAALNIVVSDSLNASSSFPSTDCSNETSTNSPTSMPLSNPTSSIFHNSTVVSLFNAPFDITVGPDGTVYWVDLDSDCIHYLDGNSNTLQTYFCSDDPDGYGIDKIQMISSGVMYNWGVDGLEKIELVNGITTVTDTYDISDDYFVNNDGSIYTLVGYVTVNKIEADHTVSEFFSGSLLIPWHNIMIADLIGNLYISGYENIVRIDAITRNVTELSLPTVSSYPWGFNYGFLWDMKYYNGNIYASYTGIDVYDPIYYSVQIGKTIGPFIEYNLETGVMRNIGGKTTYLMGTPNTKGWDTSAGVWFPLIAIDSNTGRIYFTNTFKNEIDVMYE